MDLLSLDDWLDVSKLGRVGGVIGDSIQAGIAEAKETIDDLLAVGVEVAPMGQSVKTPVKSEGASMQGKSFCFTGTRECLDDVEAAGGVIKSGVSKGLDYLVQKDATSQSGKTRKAESYGVKIISLDTLKAALAGEKPLP